MKRIPLAVVLAFAATLAACADHPVDPPTVQDGDGSPPLTAGRTPRDVPEVRIQLPPVERAWDRGPAELARTLSANAFSADVAGLGPVRAAYAVIAFKEPGSERALRTGVRARVSARAVEAGLDLLRGRGVEVVELLENIGAARVRVTPTAAAALAGDPLVDFVEPRQYASLHAETTPWGITAVRAPQAWPTTTGVGATVLIIDTGYDAGHPDLRALPISHCAGEFGGCDDAAPWHGTHVLGIVSARDNNEGVVGMGPGINGQALYMYGACNGSSCPMDEIVAGLNWGIGLGVDVVNMSLGGPHYDAALATAVAQAWSNNVVLVASAGNNGNSAIVYPAAYPNVVGVSGVGQNLLFASGLCGGSASSSYGGHVDIAAPFEALSTIGNGGYGVLCGTSMAAPHVSGAAALIRAKNPAWSAQQVVNQLLASAKPAGAAGWDPYYGYGIVDAAKAVGTQLAPPAYPSAPGVTINGPFMVNQGQTYTWSATPAGGNGSYTYMWHTRPANSSTWTWVTTASSFSLTILQGQDFHVRVTVASAGQTGEASRLVTIREEPCEGCGIN